MMEIEMAEMAANWKAESLVGEWVVSMGTQMVVDRDNRKAAKRVVLKAELTAELKV